MTSPRRSRVRISPLSFNVANLSRYLRPTTRIRAKGSRSAATPRPTTRAWIGILSDDGDGGRRDVRRGRNQSAEITDLLRGVLGHPACIVLLADQAREMHHLLDDEGMPVEARIGGERDHEVVD